MTYPTGGEQSPYRGASDYPTTQFQAVRPDQPAPQYDRPQYQPDQYQRDDRYERQGERQQSRYRDEDYRGREDYPPAGRREPEANRRLPWGRLVAVAVLLVAAAGGGGYYAGHVQGKKDGTGSGPKHLLSHTSVESYISQHYNAANVQCYGGRDMPLTANSAFTCTGAGVSFVVIVKNPDTGSYQVLKAS